MCHRQVAQLRGRLDALAKKDTALFVIDPHEVYRVRHMLREAGENPDELNVTVLADPAHTVSAAYGVAFQMRIHTEWSNRPATIVIDKQGVIRYEQRGTKYADRPTADEVLAEIDKLRKR